MLFIFQSIKCLSTREITCIISCLTEFSRALDSRLLYGALSVYCIGKRKKHRLVVQLYLMHVFHSGQALCKIHRCSCNLSSMTSWYGLIIIHKIIKRFYINFCLYDINAAFFTELRGLDLQTGIFSLRQIKAATKNFDAENKIGEGGFGSVYRVSVYIQIIQFWPSVKNVRHSPQGDTSALIALRFKHGGLEFVSWDGWGGIYRMGEGYPYCVAVSHVPKKYSS